MGTERAKARAEGLRPFPDQPIEGAAWNHGVRPTRFAMPLPTTVKGPIRARETRARKGLPGYGDLNYPVTPTPAKPARRVTDKP